MEPTPIKLPPGFFRNGTEYESAGRWYDGNLVRWDKGRMRPIGGWRRVLAGGAHLTGKARAIRGWRGNNGFRYVAIGTNEKLYIGNGGNYADLTPVGLVPGRPDGIAGPGYGVGPYGREHYGTRRATNVLALDAATWSFDTFGENLVGVLTSDGKIYQWSPSSGGLPTAVTNAPTNCVGVFTTDEGHMVALGPAGNRRKAQWCSQGDNTIWTPSSSNTAGSRNLKTDGNVIAGRLIGSQPAIWTTVDMHVLDYLQYPLVYGNRRVGDDCGLIGPNAVVAFESSAIWMGDSQFFRYDGTVRPLDCDVADYVFKDLNPLQKSKVFAFNNTRYNETTWFYASAASTENDRYVTVNRSGDTWFWYFGQIARTCWLNAGMLQYPLAVDPAGVIYEHEVGFLADTVSRNTDVFAQSGPAEIGSGAKIIYSNLLLPDATGGSAFQVRMKTRQAPEGPEASFGPYSFTPNSEGYVPVRFSGRQVAMRVEQTADQDWSLGKPRFKIAAGGAR